MAVTGLVMSIAVSGCAGTRTATLGPLGSNQALFTLTVTEDLGRVRQECEVSPRAGERILGCKKSRLAILASGQVVTRVQIVRYTDALPSDLAFGIDARQLCRTLSGLQAIVDPCEPTTGVATLITAR